MAKDKEMSTHTHTQVSPLSADFDVGDDSDLPGFGQPYTIDDIDALANSGRGTVQERREILQNMLNDLETRQGMDEADEYDYLIERIQDALAALDAPADGIGTPGAFAHDADDRLEQPDEILEREEEERERRDEE
jgi:hypothetical protein